MTARRSLRRIVVLDDYGDVAPGAADWSGLPVEFLRQKLPEDSLAEHLHDADALVLREGAAP